MSQKSCLQSHDGAQKSLEPKLSFVGPHFLMDKTWKRLIPLSLSMKRPKKIQKNGVKWPFLTVLIHLCTPPTLSSFLSDVSSILCLFSRHAKVINDHLKMQEEEKTALEK